MLLVSDGVTYSNHLGTNVAPFYHRTLKYF